MAHAPLVHSIRVLLQGPRQSVDAPAVQDFILTRFALFVHQESTNHHWEMKRVLDVQPMQIQSLDRLHGSNGATCTGCETGYYCSGGTSKIQCTANSNSPVRSTLSSQCTCNPGSYVTGATCTLCTTGVTYSTTSGASACNTCTKCGAGKYQTSACTATTDTTCANCQDKFYSLSLHNTECISCGTLQTPPTGQYRKDCNAASQGTLSNCVATKF